MIIGYVLSVVQKIHCSVGVGCLDKLTAPTDINVKNVAHGVMEPIGKQAWM